MRHPSNNDFLPHLSVSAVRIYYMSSNFDRGDSRVDAVENETAKSQGSISFGRFVVILIFIGILLGAMTKPAHAANATVVGSVVNVRSGPGTDYIISRCLYKNTRVEVLGEAGQWCQVKLGALTGWVHSSLLEADPPQMLTVGVTAANLRSGPGTDYDIIGQASLGEQLTLLGKEGDWYLIQTSDGNGAYIRQDMIAGQSEASAVPAPGNMDAKVSRIPRIVLNNRAVSLSTPPRVENQRLLVPLREMFAEAGATVGWNNASQTATVEWGSKRIVLPVNSFKPTVNGAVWKTDVPVRKYGQTTMVPLRFVVEALGGTASWDDGNAAAYVYIPPADGLKAVGVVVTAAQANMRSGPGTIYGVIGKAAKGEQMPVIKQLDGWYEVYKAGQKAWIAGWVVDVVWGWPGS